METAKNHIRDTALVTELHEFARQLAIEAGSITMRYFRKNITIEWKADRSPVTKADRETEQFIRSEIAKRYPAHSIIGEEFGSSEEKDAHIKWIIDPIDGTLPFIHGIPLYTILLAVFIDNTPSVGIIHNPPLDETVSAGTGIGCFYNRQPCLVSKTSKLSDAIVQFTDITHLMHLQPELTRNLSTRCRATRGWGDGYGYLLVASGRSDIMIDPVLNIWDIAPMLPIINEAGGKISDFTGATDAPGTSAIATNGLLHDQVMELL